jgi:hypothetical protein
MEGIKMKIAEEKQRISFMDGYDLFPEQYVLLGYTDEDSDGNIIGGVVLAVGAREERDAMWDLYVEYLLGKKGENLLLSYYGDVDTVGVFV